MGKYDFNRQQCISALVKIGFQQKNNRRGNHDKFMVPDYLNNSSDVFSFIMVPRSRQIHCQHAILKELERMGGEELVNKFLDNI